MALQPRTTELELTRGRDGRKDAFHVAVVDLLDLENGSFKGGIIVRRAGTRRLGNAVLAGGALAQALAVAGCGGEVLRWTEDGIYGRTENQTANVWCQRATENQARPLACEADNLVSRARSSDAHDSGQMGNLDIVVWTEAEEPSNQPARRVLRATVFDRVTGIRLHDAVELADDQNGTEFWRLQPRLIAYPDFAVVFYVTGGELRSRTLPAIAPQTWLPSQLLADDVAERFTTRYPFELDAVAMGNDIIRLAYTATAQGGQVVRELNNPLGNPPPIVVVAPNTTFSGEIDFLVTQDTTLILARTAVANVLAQDPIYARPAWEFTGTVAAKIIEDSSITRSVLVPPDVPARYPTMARSNYRFDGVVDVGISNEPFVVVTTPAAPPAGSLALTQAGLINSFGPGGGLLTVTIVDHFFDIDLGQWYTEFAATAPGGFTDSWSVFGANSVRNFATLGYTFTANNLAVAFTVPKTWEYQLYPLIARVALDGGPFVTLPLAGPYYMYGPGGPLDITIWQGAENLGLTVTFVAGEGANYTTTEVYRFDVQSGKVAYSVNAGPYGASLRMYDNATGAPITHEPAAGLTFSWPDGIPNYYTVNDIWTLTAPTGQFTYSRNGAPAQGPLNILDANGQPITHALTDGVNPIGVSVTWPANTEFALTEEWIATITSASRLMMMTLEWDDGSFVGPTSSVTTDPNVLPPQFQVAPTIGATGTLTVQLLILFPGPTWEVVYNWLPGATLVTQSVLTDSPPSNTYAPLYMEGGYETGLSIRLPSGQNYTPGDLWTYSLVATSPKITVGPSHIATPVLEGLTLEKQDANTALVVFRNVEANTVEARTYGVDHSLAGGPLVLASDAVSHAAEGLYHVALQSLGGTEWLAILEPLDQFPPEMVHFDMSGGGAILEAVQPWVRGVRLLTRPFTLEGRTMIGTVYLPRYGGPDADEAGVQPVALVVELETGDVLARLLPGEAQPLTSAGLPRVFADADGSVSMIIPRRGRLTLEAGERLADISPAVLASIRLREEDPATLGNLEEHRCLHVGGALPLYYDGASFSEDGFHVGPEGLEVTMSGSGGSLSAASYSYIAVYEWTDARGRRHQSAPSPAVQATAIASDSAQVVVPLYFGTSKNGVRIVLYRTTANGTIYYRLTPGAGSFLQPDPADITADTVAITDGASDASIEDNEPLYTMGGELPHLAPPAYRSIYQQGAYLWIDRMEERQDFLYSLPIRQGEGTTWAAELLGSVPETHGRLVGTHDSGGAVVLFTERGAYVIQGNGPDVTGAGNTLTEPQELPGAVGLDDHRAKVTTPAGIMFRARGKVYVLTGGFQTTEPGGGGAGYPDLTITGAMVSPEAEEVRFYSQEGTALVYSYAWQGWGTWANQPARNVLVTDGLAYRADGVRVVREDPTTTYDDVEENGTGGSAVTLAWSHSWLKLADFLGVERVWWLHLSAFFGEAATVTARYYRDLKSAADIVHTWAVTAGNAVDRLSWHLGPAYSRAGAFRVRWEVLPTTLPAVAVNQPFRFHALAVEFGAQPGKNHRAARRT